MHHERTAAEDHAIVTVRFDGRRLGLIETSWAKPGGMDDRAELIGSTGITYVDILRGSALMTYSENGYGYAVEKAPRTSGWTFTMFEEIWNYGFPQEMRHFVECVQHGSQPAETGEDGRAVLEIIMAAYESARTGARVALPFHPRVAKPIDLWRSPSP